MRRPMLKGASDWSDADYLEYYKSKCIVTEKGCWEWQGWKCLGKGMKDRSRGYAEGNYRGKKYRLSRLLLGWKLGRPLTKEERACHECDNPPCINQDHLYPGTDKKNMQDAGRKRRWPRQYRDTCIHGHPRTPENAVRHGRAQKLQCRVCLKERWKRAWASGVARERQRRNRRKRQQLNRGESQ